MNPPSPSQLPEVISMPANAVANAVRGVRKWGLNRRRARQRSLTERILSRTVWFSLVFMLLVAALMGLDYRNRLAKDPLDSDDFRELKAQLVAEPKNEAVKEEIRKRDLELRRAYFVQRRRAHGGAVLLGAAALVLVTSLKIGSLLRRRPLLPEPQTCRHDVDQSVNRAARWAVALTAVVLAGGAIALVENSPPGLAALLKPSADESGGKTAPGGYPSKEEIAANWPCFRGPGGSGVSAVADVPTVWNAKTGDGIVWKTPIPEHGNSSPVVWGGRVFLTGATKEARYVYCVETAGGKVLWRKEVPASAGLKLPEVNEETGYASPTATTDGRRVYAIFATGDLAAFDYAGNLVWSKHLGVPKNPYGHATSLTMWRNFVVVLYDQASPRDNLSKMFAFDGATGETVWEAPRKMPCTWATPIVIDVNGREQIFTAGEPWGIAYDPANGKELWRVDCLQQEIGPSPVAADGVVYTVNSAPALTAIRADGAGDVTKTKVLWRAEDNLPDTCSPLVVAKQAFLLTTPGILTCYEASSGKMLWEHDFENRFKSSPSLAGNRIYLFSDEGKAFVVEPGEKDCRTVSTNEMGEPVLAGPAFLPGRLYVRGKNHLFCIGKK